MDEGQKQKDRLRLYGLPEHKIDDIINMCKALQERSGISLEEAVSCAINMMMPISIFDELNKSIAEEEKRNYDAF